jgi:tetratricopeptide (TPR) repeat protein
VFGPFNAGWDFGRSPLVFVEDLFFNSAHGGPLMTRRQRIVLLIAFVLVLPTVVSAQLPNSTLPTSSSQPGAGSRRGFTLYGDLKVEDSQSDSEVNTMFDVILYTRGNEVFARQRVGNGGRYRFNNVFNGDYYLAVELDNVEVARMSILIPTNAVEHIKQDLEFRWKGGPRPLAGVVAADSYNRSQQNRALYEKGTKEIAKNDLVKATETLRSLVEADPKDYPAWNELGMVYFIQKDLEAAANAYTKAIELKPDYVTALVSLGRVRLAQKNNEAAVTVLETAIKADPKSASANYFLGEAYLAVKKGSLAVNYLNEALKLDPVGMANAHLRLATLYNLAGYKDRAALEYNEFLKKKPDYPDAQKLRDYIKANNPRSNRDADPAPSPSPKP